MPIFAGVDRDRVGLSMDALSTVEKRSTTHKTSMEAEAANTGGLSDLSIGEAVGGAGASANRTTLERGQEPPGAPENARHRWASVHEPAL